jgi:protein O-GlcNAc transferase
MPLKAQDSFVQALVLHQAGRLSEARRLYEATVNADPTHFDALHMLGIVAHQMHDPKQAVTWIDKAIAVNSRDASAHYNRGLALAALQRLDEAIHSYSTAIALNPNYTEAYSSRGTAFQNQGEIERALSDCRKATALNPGYANAWHNQGAALYLLHRYEEAVTCFERALSLDDNDAESHNSLGAVLFLLKQPSKAMIHHDRAARLNPNDAKIWRNRGVTLMGLRRLDEAIACFDQTLRLDPKCAEAMFDRAVALNKLGRIEEALESYGALIQLDPDFRFAEGLFLHTKMLCCDWHDIDKLYTDITIKMRAGKPAMEPFSYQGLCDNEADLKTCAEIYAAHNYPTPAVPLDVKAAARHDRIRLGYLSGEFRNQATSILMAELFELHDRSRFEVFALDNGWSDQSALRARLEKSFDRIFNIFALSDREAAALIRREGIDILINLNGYFGDGRQGVFAFRPSPIQVNYLGFPGTLGAEYMDYLIADETVIPETSRQYYTEKIVWLPDCYQVNDRQRKIADKKFARADLGLPAEGFVFCCFNNPYKITPGTFDAWARILNRVDDSVLWLLPSNPAAARNLAKEAGKRGINPSRLVFADPMPAAEHLARHGVGDLFLDTLPYNAHTTASDALWAGLPVLTLTGHTFPGRVATSLLKAAGLPEMIVGTAQAYEDLAVELAQNPARLTIIKKKLAQNRDTTPLFDTPRFAKNIEAAFLRMYARSQAGLAPEHIRLT